MIVLTAEQQQAIEQGQPVRVVDPLTQGAYVVVRAEVFDQLLAETPNHAVEPDIQIAPGILRSMQAFWRDLPELLKVRRNRDKWVAYHGEERVGIAADDVTLIRELVRRKIPDDEYHLATIRPRTLAPWEEEEIEAMKPEHRDEY
jgi:hypothetical protein